MTIQRQESIIINLTTTEYNSLVEEIKNDEKSFLAFFEKTRKVGNETKKELCSIKIKNGRTARLDFALKQNNVSEFCFMEYTDGIYKFHYSKTDGSIVHELAFVKLSHWGLKIGKPKNQKTKMCYKHANKDIAN